MRRIYIVLFLIIIFTTVSKGYISYNDDYVFLKQQLIGKYSNLKPKKFSQWLPGIKKIIKTGEKIIALTFDACGGKRGSKFDKKLIDYLISENIKATLFISGSWIDNNPDNFNYIKNIKIFDIANHGLKHKPCSVRGYKGYNIVGTKNIAEVVDEIELNARKIYSLTGKNPIFFRPGSAFFDDVALKIVYDLNYIPVNFSSVSGDADRKISTQRLINNIIRSAKNGAILIFHMNHPEGATLRALQAAIPQLKRKGFSFVKLKEYQNCLE